MVCRRWRAIGLFLAAYLVVWLATAVLLVMAAVASHGVDLGLGLPLGSTALVLAGLWQATPAKQHCLNRCHWLPRLSPFGWAADRDCIRFGLVSAGWCVGTCWALMTAPLAAKGGHLAVMAVVSVVTTAERLRPVRSARWRVRALLGLRG